MSAYVNAVAALLCRTWASCVPLRMRPRKRTTTGGRATPSGTPHPTLFSQTGPAARLHGVYLQAIDSAATHAAQSAPSDAPLEDRFVAGEVR